MKQNLNEKILRALDSDRGLSPEQIAKRFGLSSEAAARSLVTKLRQEGNAIYANVRSDGSVRYRVGMPSRSMVAFAAKNGFYSQNRGNVAI